MKEGSDGPPGSVAGGPALHRPVLRTEILTALGPRSGRTYVDGTFGAGGYTRAILDIPGTRVIGLDRDPSAAQAATTVVQDYPDRFTFREGRFGDLEEIVGELCVAEVHGVVLDIGVSSMQLDEAERGFSFRFDGPLDMRMELHGQSAADLVNQTDEATLAAILYRFGEERDSRRIARAIVHDRVSEPYTRTKQLADLVGRVVRNAPKGVHPATRTFQALRIAVNDELGQLLAGLEAAERVLVAGGILAVVTFHSLEDRIVKRFFARAGGRSDTGSRHRPDAGGRASASFTLTSGQPIMASEREVASNPRARSAKLRWGVRASAPPRGLDAELQKLAELGLPSGRS